MSITIGKTRATCPVCGGSGRLKSRRSTWNADGGRIVQGPTVTAEQACSACHGSGSIAQAVHDHNEASA